MLPKMDKPRILDIGCGSGIPTLELARLSQGDVIGIDIDESALNQLAGKIKESGLTDRIKAVNCSMLDMDFAEGSFDIIWSEGSIYAIGLEKGLREWKRFLKPGGFIVVHDEAGNVKDKLEHICNCGYELIGYFILSKEIWWTAYFAPLERLINKTRSELPYKRSAQRQLQQAEGELDMYKKNPERNNSVYFVIKENSGRL